MPIASMILNLADIYPILMALFLLIGKMIYLVQTIPVIILKWIYSNSNTNASKLITHYLGRGPDNDTPPYTEKQDSSMYTLLSICQTILILIPGQQVHMAGDLESEVTGGR